MVQYDVSVGNLHVYFYALPTGAYFMHKSKLYKKVGKELATYEENGLIFETIFESHYGCLVSKARSFKVEFGRGDIRPYPRKLR